MTEALGNSEIFLIFQEQLSRVAPINRPVLLVGERGTGKELAASRIHYLSKRWQGPFVALNCAALEPTLIGSELFGFEKGAFTGAQERRKGRFEVANGGTLFLDEIGNIPIEVQERILRVVEYGTFERIGSAKPMEVDVRIVAATNVDLKQLSLSGTFMPDLLDRLSFEVIFLPPLRMRGEDIMLLSHHFAARMAFELERGDIPVFSSAVIERLNRYPWPGNVRELKNVVERAVCRSNSNTITDVDFDPFHSPYAEIPVFLKTDYNKEDIPDIGNDIQKIMTLPFKEAVSEFEFRLLENALKQLQYNQRKAARQMGITYHQFRGLYRKYQNRLK